MGGLREGGRVYHTSPHTLFQTSPTFSHTSPHFPSKPKTLEFSHFQITSVIISYSMFGTLESCDGKPLVVACNCPSSFHGFPKKEAIFAKDKLMFRL